MPSTPMIIAKSRRFSGSLLARLSPSCIVAPASSCCPARAHIRPSAGVCLCAGAQLGESAVVGRGGRPLTSSLRPFLDDRTLQLREHAARLEHRHSVWGQLLLF